jgi:hypothetical protein
MSAKSYAYLRLAIAFTLATLCSAECALSLVFPSLKMSGIGMCALPVVTLLFCAYCVAKPPQRGLPGSVNSMAFTGLVLICVAMPLTILAYPVCQLMVEAPAQGQLKTRMKEIGFAMHAYHDLHEHFPPSAVYNKDGMPLLSWRVALLPHLGHDDLYRQFKLDEPWDSPTNLPLAAQMPAIYAMPAPLADHTAANFTYLQVYVGRGTAFEGKEGISVKDFPDGTSNTVLVVVAPEPVLWTKPADLEFSAKVPLVLPKAGRSPFPTALFADADVRSLPDSWTEDQWRAVITRNGGEPRPAEF